MKTLTLTEQEAAALIRLIESDRGEISPTEDAALNRILDALNATEEAGEEIAA